MHTPTPSPLLHNRPEVAIAKGLRARIAQNGWPHPVVGFVSLDEQGNILSDDLLATGLECLHISPCAALKAALARETQTLLVWHFQSTPSKRDEAAFNEFAQNLHYGCIEFEIRLRLLTISPISP